MRSLKNVGNYCIATFPLSLNPEGEGGKQYRWFLPFYTAQDFEDCAVKEKINNSHSNNKTVTLWAAWPRWS